MSYIVQKYTADKIKEYQKEPDSTTKLKNFCGEEYVEEFKSSGFDLQVEESDIVEEVPHHLKQKSNDMKQCVSPGVSMNDGDEALVHFKRVSSKVYPVDDLTDKWLVKNNLHYD